MTLLAISCFHANNCPFKGNGFTGRQTADCLEAWHYVRNRPATKPVILKVCNVKLSFDIWLVLYMYFILYSWYIWFSTLVLQQSPDSLSSQHFTKDATKSSSMDSRSILHISYIRDQDYIRSSFYTPSSQKTL